jgi:hypothetical protein
MRRPRRLLRAAAWLFTVITAATLLLSAASLLGISWSAQFGDGFDLFDGALNIRWRGPSVRLTTNPGLHVGRHQDRTVSVTSNGWISTSPAEDWFIVSWAVIRSGPVPSLASSLVLLSIHVSLIRLSLITAPVPAALWLLSRRRAPKDSCPSCSYDLRGLAPNSPCPECGHAS